MDINFAVITICGSMRFYPKMLVAAEQLSKLGYIVLMPFVTFSPEKQASSRTKHMLDKMHFAKIDMSTEIYVVNIDGYVGESTTNEIEYAKLKNKQIWYDSIQGLSNG